MRSAAGQAVAIVFQTSNADDEVLEPDTLPTAILWRNGEDSGVTVTIENLVGTNTQWGGIGLFSASWTNGASWSAGDQLTLFVEYTFGTYYRAFTPYRGYIDATIDSRSTFNNTTDTVDVGKISGDATAADNLELDYDGTGYAKSNSTIGTCTTNTDMRGTDNAFLAASAPANFGDLAITASTGQVTVGTNNDKTGYSISGTITTLDALDTQVTAKFTEIKGAGWNSASDTLEQIGEKAILITTQTVINSPLAADGETLTIVAKNDYLVKDGREIAWETVDLDRHPDLTGATIIFTAKRGDETFSVEGAVISPTGNQSWYIELTDTDTDVTPTDTHEVIRGQDRPVAPWKYEIDAILYDTGGTDPSKVTLVRGELNVLSSYN